MSIGDCPNFPQCGHKSESQCDADICGNRPKPPDTQDLIVRLIYIAGEGYADYDNDIDDYSNSEAIKAGADALVALQAELEQSAKYAEHIDATPMTVAEMSRCIHGIGYEYGDFGHAVIRAVEKHYGIGQTVQPSQSGELSDVSIINLWRLSGEDPLTFIDVVKAAINAKE